MSLKLKDIKNVFPAPEKLFEEVERFEISATLRCSYALGVPLILVFG
jgi:hypothetical protein